MTSVELIKAMISDELPASYAKAWNDYTSIVVRNLFKCSAVIALGSKDLIPDNIEHLIDLAVEIIKSDA